MKVLDYRSHGVDPVSYTHLDVYKRQEFEIFNNGWLSTRTESGETQMDTTPTRRL